MKEKHFARTSKLLLMIHIVTTIFLFAGIISQLMMSGLEPYRSLVPLVLNVVCIVSGCIGYKVFHGGLKYVRLIAISFSVLYFGMLVFSANGNTFPYMVPFLIVFVLSMDQISTKVAGFSFLVANLLRVILTVGSAEKPDAVMEVVMIEVICTILVFLAATKGASLLILFFKDSMDEVEEKSEKNRLVTQKIMEVSDGVEQKAEKMAESLEVISRATQQLNASMEDISDGTSSTAENIANQNMRTQEIQNILEITHTNALDIVHLTSDTQLALKEGTEAIEGLFAKVNNAIQVTEKMQITSEQLQEQTEQVRGITNIILNISSQTNLLALNASIEAARAGESGRGFAVVADEIRNLADQTRQETENITKLIDALSTNAKEVISQVEETVVSSKEEDEYAHTASGKFEQITEKIMDLSKEIGEIVEQIKKVRDANTNIVDSINSISSVSEEINASTLSAKDLSEHNVDMMGDFSEAMEDILSQVQELKHHA